MICKIIFYLNIISISTASQTFNVTKTEIENCTTKPVDDLTGSLMDFTVFERNNKRNIFKLKNLQNFIKLFTLKSTKSWMEHITGSTARHRHRRQQILPLMILGIVVFGIIVIPTGFQFLAVLGGKAFLMAKLALLLASINGLKRVASSGVHYGLYHTDGGHYPHNHLAVAPISSHYWHDRDGTMN